MSFYPDHEPDACHWCGEPATEDYSGPACRPCVAYDIASEKADAAWKERNEK
jgi:hypothetical protein